MDIIVVNNRRGQTWRLSLSLSNVLVWLPVAAALLLFSAGVAGAGYWLAARHAAEPMNIAGIWADDIAAQRATLAKTRQELQDETHAVARRLAKLQAHVIRLDAAGQRLTEIADLDAGEFDFDSEPPVGGPETDAIEDQQQSLGTLMNQLDRFERQLSDRERQMRVLEDLLLASRLQKEVKPSGWPVIAGWISSGFGLRTDPFTGRRTRHQGVDFAGREGSNVLSVASGVVTWAGSRFGYGNLIEINHGNGYVTRYGHNKSVKVKVGDRVKKGQLIALMGSTGRSTGPHVHFEVLLNGRVVDPSLYVQAAR